MKLLAEFFLPLFIIFSLSPLNAANKGNGILKGVQEGNIKTAFTSNDDYADLTSFGKAIGDKSIVVLDEATHGEGNVFALKARLIKYLHEQKGFDIFLFESGLYDVSRMWLNDARPIAEQAPGNLFYMYANSREMQPLFAYIDAQRLSKRPLYFAGFDNRHSGTLSSTELISSLKSYLTEAGSIIPKDSNWLTFESAANSLINSNEERPSSLAQHTFFSLAVQISNFTNAARGSEAPNSFNSSGFWHRITKSLTRMAEISWNGRSVADHDLEMAQNIKWLMEEVYPNKKVVIWGQYVHLSPYGNTDHTSGPPEANVGTELKRMWPNEVYTVHFGGSKGSYTNFITLQEKQLSLPPRGSLEDILNKKRTTSAFIDASNLNLEAIDLQKTTMWTYHYDDSERVLVRDWSKHWNGMFLLNPIRPVDYIQR